jgi:hypothetical protein
MFYEVQRLITVTTKASRYIISIGHVFVPYFNVYQVNISVVKFKKNLWPCNLKYLTFNTQNKSCKEDIINLKFRAKHEKNVIALIYRGILNGNVFTGCSSTDNRKSP